MSLFYIDSELSVRFIYNNNRVIMKRKYDFNVKPSPSTELISYRNLSTIYSGSPAITVKENPWSVDQFNNYRSNLFGKNTASLSTIWSEEDCASSSSNNKKKIKNNDERIDRIKHSINPFYIGEPKPTGFFNTYIKPTHHEGEQELEPPKDFTAKIALIKLCKNKCKRFLTIFRDAEAAVQVENFPLRKSTNIFLAKGLIQ